MSLWLFAESEFNRQIDEENNFQYLVINKKKLNKKKILIDDYLVTYVTKIMKITDVRKVVNNTPKILPTDIKYDRHFDYYLDTKLVIKKEKSEWIDRSIIFPKLEIFNNKIANLVLLNSPIKLSENDAKKFLEIFGI
jgi:hypothetical protein